MKISKKILIPLLFLIIAAAAGGGYYLWHGKTHKAGEEKAAQEATQYTCPMHPFIIKEKPGACPICSMSLVPVKKGGEGKPDAGELKSMDEVSLSPTQRLMANVATVEARLEPLDREIAAVGIVAYDQSRQAKVTSWVAGRIDRLFVDKVGDRVSTKRPVAEIYSPDLVSTQQEYLLALRSRDRLKDSPISSISEGGEGLVAAARQRLKLWGVKDSQISALEKAGEPNIRLPIFTPLSGIVIDKLVLEGQYVKEGDPLFNVADLSTVWVDVEVYENEFPFVKVGQKVEFTSQSYPGRPFSGRVSFIYPFLDPKMRTVKVRVEIPNPALRLKPEMFVRGTIRASLGEVLTVPVTAVLDTGKRRVVWVETEPGNYSPRDVKTGDRSGERIRIISGLKAGEKVAESGGYLIDSEAQLKGGAGGGHAGHEGMKTDGKGAPAPPAGHEGHGSPSPEKDGMSMDDMKM